MKFLNNLKGTVILLVTAVIWGLAFVAQSDAADKIPPFLFNSLRSLIGSSFIFLCLCARKFLFKTPIFPKEGNREGWRSLLLGGLICGIALTASANLQQLAISLYPDGVASEARAGFLTALYVILVPISSVFRKKRLRPIIWISVLVATIGVYLLCLSGGISGFYLADVLLILCAVCFTLHILAVDRFGKEVDGIALSAVQFFVCGILSGLMALCFENISNVNYGAVMFNILFMGIVSGGIGYTLQIIGQKYAEPTVASITMSLESVFAAIGGWIILQNKLTLPEIFGCILMFAAIVMAQLSGPKDQPTEEKAEEESK